MKNKLINIFLALIFNIFFFNYTIAEEFNFNITELQITESGNLIKGIKGGTVTTRNNELIITAENFKYNKLTTLLEAEGNVKLVDKIADVIVEANKIFYFKNKEEIFTLGRSRALRGDYIEINSDEYFKYNKLTSLLEAQGNVTLEDKIKNISVYTNQILYLMNKEKISTIGETDINVEDKYYIEGNDLVLLRNKMILSSNRNAIITDNDLNIYELEKFQYLANEEILKGEKIKIITNAGGNKSDQHFFQEGFFNLKKNKFLGKDVNIIFHKELYNNEDNDPRVSSVSGYGDEFNTYLDKAVFTSCKKTDKCPPWKMSATNVRHDKIKKQIIYKNAWLNLYDFPVVYFPKFFHPDPSVKRQSGLIRPEIGDHDTLGDSIYLPYFFVISDDKDFTIKPRLFNRGINVLQGEYRQETKNTLSLIDASITTGHKSNKNEQEGSRSHFFANSTIDLAKENFINSNVKIKFEKTSNDTYLKLFDFMKSPILGNTGTLESSIKLDLAHENYDFRSSIIMYETLNGGSNSDRYYYTLPDYDYSKIFNLENFNGTFYFNSSGSNNLSNTNVTTTSINNGLSFGSYSSYTLNGIQTNFGISLANNNSMGKNGGQKNTPQSELISHYTYNVLLPLLKNTENSRNRLTPKLSLRVRPHSMKDNSAGSGTINADTIFSSTRIGAEAGESLTLGVDFVKQKINTQPVEGEELNEIEEYFDFKLATVFRLKDENNIPSASTLNKRRSNIFGKAQFNPNKNTVLDYAFSLTNRLDRFENNSIGVGFNFDNFTTKFNFTEYSGALGNSNVVSNTTKFIFNEFNSLSFGTRRNREINLTEYYDLVYEYKNDCLIADIKYRKDYYNSADIIPKEELFFSITIIPFYTYSPDKMILNKDRLD
mgnify:CR=1 FL=1